MSRSSRLLVVLLLSCAPCVAQNVAGVPQLDPFGGVATVNCPASGGVSSAVKVNTTSGTAVNAPGSVTITPASMTNIVNNMFLDIDPGKSPVVVSSEQIGTGNGVSTVFTFSLAHASMLQNSLSIFVGGVLQGTEQWGEITGSGIAAGTANPPTTSFITEPKTSTVMKGRVAFASAPGSGIAITVSYAYLPTEVVQVTGVTGSTFTATFQNTHASGFQILQGYADTAQVSISGVNHWVYCDPLNKAAHVYALWPNGPDSHFTSTAGYAGTLVVNTTGPTAVTSTGSQVYAPTSMTGIASKETLHINQGLSDAESVVVTAVGALTFTVNFTRTHPLNFTIQCCENTEVTTQRYGDSNFFWGERQIPRLKNYGFNGAFNGVSGITPYASFNGTGNWSLLADHSNPHKWVTFQMPAYMTSASIDQLGYGPDPVKDLFYGHDPAGIGTVIKGVVMKEMPDVYDSGLYTFVQNLSANTIAESPWLFGTLQDESDEYPGLGGAGENFFTTGTNLTNSNLNSPHWGIISLAEAPHLSAEKNHGAVSNGAIYQNSTNNIKSALSTFLSGRYATIGALNTAWGSNYTSFGTTGTVTTGTTVGTTDGSTTAFSATLGGKVDLFSLAITASVSGGPQNVVIAGDTGNGIVYAYSQDSNVVNATTTQAVSTTGSPVTLTLSSYSNIKMNDMLLVDTGTNAEIVQVTAFGKSCSSGCAPSINSITAQFAKTHGSGSTVTRAFQLSPTSSINYSTGLVTLTFSTAPVTGVTLKANFEVNGYGTGTGILDENGACPSKTSTCWLSGSGVFVDTSGAPMNKAGTGTVTFQKDISDFFVQVAGHYAQNVQTSLHASLPHTIVVSQYGIGGHWTPGRGREVYQAMAPYVDVWNFNIDTTQTDVASNFSAYSVPADSRLNYIARWGGDKPWMQFLISSANPDSANNTYGINQTSAGGTQDVVAPTQLAKGQQVQSWSNAIFNTVTINNDTQGVGIGWWTYVDNPVEKGDYGVASYMDNLYSGVCAPGTAELIGSASYTRLPEQACYGDFLDTLYSTWKADLATFSGPTPPAPSAPTALQVTALTNTTISLGWTAPSSSFTGYSVYRATVHGGPYVAAASGLTSPSFTDTGLAAGTYFYVVTAFNGGILSGVMGNGTTATATCTAACTFATSSTINIQGDSVAGFNGSFTVTGQPTSTTVTFASNVNSTGTGGGIWQSGAESPNSNEVSAMVPPVTTVSLVPASLTFGSFTVGVTSPSQSTVLTNTSTTGAAVTLSSIVITGTNSGDFAQSNNCPASLAQGASCTITVTFTPLAPGSRSASVSVTDTASGSPQTVALAGTGVAQAPAVALVPSSLVFGPQALSTTSAQQTIVLQNTGSGTLVITSISLTGTNAGDFGSSTTCGGTLGAGLTCSINVTFTPTATGTRIASVSVADSAAGSPHTAALTGTGTTTKCALVGVFTLSGVTITCGP